MKKLGLIISALALVLGMSQCRKPVLPTYNGGTSTKTIEFTANYGGGEKGNFIENEVSHVLKYQWDNDATDGKTDKLYVFAQTGGETFTAGRYLGTLKITKVSDEGYTGHFFGKLKDVPNSGVLRFVHYGQGITVDETTGAASVDFSTQTGELRDVSSKVVAICDYPYENFSTELEIKKQLIVQFAVAKMKFENFDTDNDIKLSGNGNIGLTINTDGTKTLINSDNFVILVKPSSESFYTVFMPTNGSSKTKIKYRFRNIAAYAEYEWEYDENKYYTHNGDAGVIIGSPSHTTPTMSNEFTKCYNYATSCKGTVTLAEEQVVEYGFVCSKKDGGINPPVIGGNGCKKVDYTINTMTATSYDFTFDLTTLETGVEYYVRAYAIGDNGTIVYSGSDITLGGNVAQEVPDSWHTNGTIPHPFTVGKGTDGVLGNDDDVKVYFSRGNLQWSAEGTHNVAVQNAEYPYGTEGTWRFAPYQFECKGHDNDNFSETYTGWIDLFPWASSGYKCNVCYSPWSRDTDNLKYGPGTYTTLTGDYANSDWGVYNAIENGGNSPGIWRMLTLEECKTIGEKGNWAHGSVDCTNGFILLPDDWDWSKVPAGLRKPEGEGDLKFTYREYPYSNKYTYLQWKEMESLGAVFLPAAGKWRPELTASHIVELQGFNGSGDYASSTARYFSPYKLSFADSWQTFDAGDGVNACNSTRLPVRLVRNVPSTK